MFMTVTSGECKNLPMRSDVSICA